MKKKSIIVTGTTYPRWPNDSVANFVEELCQQIAPAYETVRVIVPHDKGAKIHEQSGNIRIKRFRYMFPVGVQNIAYGGGGVFKIKKTPWYALKLFGFATSSFFNLLFAAMDKQVTVINAHWVLPQGFIAVFVKFLTGKRVVISVHGGDIFGLEGGFMTGLKRFALKHADHVIANSSATKRACQAVYADVPISVIPMGIDRDTFAPGPRPERLVERYGLRETFTMLFVGRLTKVKGVEYLLEAAQKLRDAGVEFKLLIVGDGPDRPELEAFVKKHQLTKYVVFVGWVNKAELPEYYHAADVMVGPSLHEALGVVFIEAQTGGVPVVASNVDGIPDVVVDGETGFLVERKSAQALFERLKQLYDDPRLRQKLARQAHKTISEHFSWQHVAKRYLEVLNKAS